MPLNFFPLKYKALSWISLLAIIPSSYSGLNGDEIWGNTSSSIFKRTTAARAAIPTSQLIQPDIQSQFLQRPLTEADQKVQDYQDKMRHYVQQRFAQNAIPAPTLEQELKVADTICFFLSCAARKAVKKHKELASRNMGAVNATQKDYNKEIESAQQKCKDINLPYSEFGAPYLAAKIASLLSNEQKEGSENSRSTEPTVQLLTEKKLTHRSASKKTAARERGQSALRIQNNGDETTPSPA